MRKANPEAVEPQLVPSEETELARVVPIRTETTLTRYPVHKIAKRGSVRIKQTKQNERGKTVTTWEVKHPSGPLGYKVDTLIINRRIDEMRTGGEIRQLFKVGSLRDICEELGVTVSGKTANAIKEAIRENAGALITAKIEYRGNDGTEREFEFTTTRYTVIFTGEKLPNEKKADAVYIELHPRYHEMLKHSKTRPLDYEYLKALPPSAQRLYELLSFAMFGTLKHDRSNAQMLYSEFCQSAPLTRYHEWEQVKKQLYKIHQPHKQSGYIKAVEFEETRDERGSIDWVMKYTPGRKAKHEFRQFTTREGKRELEQRAQTPRLVPAPAEDEQTAAPPISTEDAAIIAQLVAHNITEAKARELAMHRREATERELEAFPHRDRAKMKDPAAWLIKAIESGNYSQPAKAEEKRAKREAEKKAEENRRIEEIRQNHRQRFLPKYLKHVREELARIEREHAEAFEQFNEFVKEEREKAERMKVSKLRVEEIISFHADWFFNDAYWRKFQIPFTSFWEWDEKKNPTPFKQA